MSPSTLVSHIAPIAAALLPLLLDAALKGAAVLLIIALAASAMRRAPASARHIVWVLGAAGLLILPLLCATLPGWPILPRWIMHAAAPAAAPAVAPPATDQAFAAADPPPHMETASPAPNPPAPLPPLAAPAPPPPLHIAWQPVVLLAWLIGTAAYLAYIALAFLSLRSLERRSSRITAGPWPVLLRQLRAEIGFHRHVELLTTPHRTMPMTWGLRRTRILVPAEADGWTADQRRAVLLHELAHARRFDCLTQLLVQLACALHWFNPLAWLAWKRIQAERELACDDLVLRSGARATDYAQQLLRIASEMPSVRFSAAAIAMARPSELESRLLAILDPRRNRRTLTRNAILLAAALLAAMLLPLAMARALEEPPAPIPAGQFRLALKDIADDADHREARVTVQTAGGGYISTAVEGDRNSGAFGDANPTGLREGSVVLKATRLSPPRPDGIQFEVLIREQMPNGNYAGGPAGFALPPETKLSDFFKVTAKPGDYPLDTPVEIAQRNGKPVMLTVGKSALLPGPPAQAPAEKPLAKHSKLALERAAKLRADIRKFTLDLRCQSTKDEPPYALRLSVSAQVEDTKNPFFVWTLITEDQARKIIDHLEAEGFLDQAVSLAEMGFIPKPTTPGYTLTVGGLYADLGWNLPMLKRLDGLRSVLEGEAAQRMDALLARLSGERKQWTQAGNADQPVAKPSKMALERSAKLRADIREFTLDLRYNGDQDKPYRQLCLSVPAIRVANLDLQAQITEEQARKIIDHLEAEGFFEQAFSLMRHGIIPKPAEPGYTLIAGDLQADLGWNLPLLKRLDGLRSVLEGDAAQRIDALLARLGGERKQWTQAVKANEPPLTISALVESPPSVQIQGRVVDDRTGEPVTHFSIQGGRVDPKDPGKIVWGWGIETSDPHVDGAFFTNVGWSGSGLSRIIAPGYVPQPIVFDPPKPGQTIINGITVRLKRGRTVAGHVVDSSGKPVKGASVFVVGTSQINLTGGKAVRSYGREQTEDKNAVNATTDGQGAFAVTGIGEDNQQIAVTCAAVDLWIVPAPQADAAGDFVIRLPQPGKLIVHYFIHGAPEKSQILSQFHTWETPGW